MTLKKTGLVPLLLLLAGALVSCNNLMNILGGEASGLDTTPVVAASIRGR